MELCDQKGKKKKKGQKEKENDVLFKMPTSRRNISWLGEEVPVRENCTTMFCHLE